MTYDQWKTAYPPEYDELRIPVDELEKELKKFDARNPDCWPICSFCGKDADLETTGCSGIKKLQYPDEDTILVTYGGHKTVCGVNQENVYNMPDVDVEFWMEVCTEIVCGCLIGGYWSGDDWSLTFEDELEIKWEYTGEPNDIGEDIEYDLVKTAKKIHDSVIKIIESDYEPELILVDDAIGSVYNDAIKKYGE